MLRIVGLYPQISLGQVDIVGGSHTVDTNAVATEQPRQSVTDTGTVREYQPFTRQR
jgi:hypothetical protein